MECRSSGCCSSGAASETCLVGGGCGTPRNDWCTVEGKTNVVEEDGEPCKFRWRTARPAPHDRLMLETWHKLLAILALFTDRTAVLPLFHLRSPMASTNTREHTAAGSTPHGGAEDGPGHEDQNMICGPSARAPWPSRTATRQHTCGMSAARTAAESRER